MLLECSFPDIIEAEGAEDADRRGEGWSDLEGRKRFGSWLTDRHLSISDNIFARLSRLIVEQSEGRQLGKGDIHTCGCGRA